MANPLARTLGDRGLQTDTLLDTAPTREQTDHVSGKKSRGFALAAGAGFLVAGIIVVVFLLSGQLSPPGTGAKNNKRVPTTPKEGELTLFKDHFAGPKLNPDWQRSEHFPWKLVPDPGGKGHVLQGAPGTSENTSMGKRALQWGDLTLTDYAVEASLGFASPIPRSGFQTDAGILLARMRDPDTYYFLAYNVFNRKPYVTIQKCIDNQRSILSGIWLEEEPQTGRWYLLRLEVQGDRLRGSVNGKKIPEAMDSSFPSGRAGISRALAGKTDVDIMWKEVCVKKLPGAMK
jgi:hypothetical protein